MDGLTTRLNKLSIGPRTHIGFADGLPDEVPFCPPVELTSRLHDTPRYLFRVYSKASAGENTNECMKSIDALENNLTDIFARDDASKTALTLNEHLRWKEKSYGDPFISWTTSILVAIQYAIYKHKKDPTPLRKIHLCIIDTTLFRSGVFMRDLDLMEEFHDKVPGDHSIVVKDRKHTWKERGLNDFCHLRKKQHKFYSGVYYFGEYLSQGQTNIKGRSCTVTCDRIINDHLFSLIPSFKVELKDPRAYWADAVVKFRESFYRTEEPASTNGSEFEGAVMIALQYGKMWFLPILANLLAMRPRMPRDFGILLRILDLFSDELIRSLSSEDTKVVANKNIPEVLAFRNIVCDIRRYYYAECADASVRSMKDATN
ncbi:hypothetical protein VFPPC_04241 [Pochonia chlamydosporia 170]|uniref:DUF7587 domain-containing protein n=1 Tax=Pochonia chlamydosporia 170 TaxID=1380566 RepID=A0A179FQP9_METCM|nr:hypothetical protein VFPPC_04241 [Pochonia chlamydosporia 170]OAQ67912.1 hypothetical protein VFPPC_04241 [Pochonia chlamydosporia 170]